MALGNHVCLLFTTAAECHPRHLANSLSQPCLRDLLLHSQAAAAMAIAHQAGERHLRRFDIVGPPGGEHQGCFVHQDSGVFEALAWVWKAIMEVRLQDRR